MICGQYHVTADSEEYRICPENAKGQRIPITKRYNRLYLRHPTGETVVFARYWHMNRWYWRDERQKGPCDETHVVSEVARMLFGNKVTNAVTLLIRVVSGETIV